MTVFLENKTNVALYVDDIIRNLKPDSRSTIVIRRGPSEVCSVTFAITESLEDSEKTQFKPYMTISSETIMDG